MQENGNPFGSKQNLILNDLYSVLEGFAKSPIHLKIEDNDGLTSNDGVQLETIPKDYIPLQIDENGNVC